MQTAAKVVKPRIPAPLMATAMRLRSTRPGLDIARMSKAVVLAANHCQDIKPLYAATAETCRCPDFQRRGAKACKHMLAVWLMKQVCGLREDPPPAAKRRGGWQHVERCEACGHRVPRGRQCSHCTPAERQEATA